MEKSLSITASVLAILSSSLASFGGGYWLSQSNISLSQTTLQSQKVEIVFNRAISDLPPEKRKFAEGVVESITGVLKAADGSESEIRAAARDFRERLSEAALLSYDVSTSPFPLARQRTVMLCDDTFSVAYQLDNSDRSQRFLINGKIHSGVPGVVFEVKDGEKQLRLRYMEYLSKDETPILSFVCS